MNDYIELQINGEEIGKYYIDRKKFEISSRIHATESVDKDTLIYHYPQAFFYTDSIYELQSWFNMNKNLTECKNMDQLEILLIDLINKLDSYDGSKIIMSKEHNARPNNTSNISYTGTLNEISDKNGSAKKAPVVLLYCENERPITSVCSYCKIFDITWRKA